MRDKLIELLNKAFDEQYSRLVITAPEAADHLLANGVIVPPCKVGDTVYCIRYDFTRKPFVKPLEVLSITIGINGDITVFTTKEDLWGKKAFATREEAEKALEGVE